MSTPRRGVSLSTKLVLAITLLLAAAVGAGTFWSQSTMDELTKDSIESRRHEGEAAMARQARLAVRNLVSSASLPLAEGNFSYLEELAKQTLADDERIDWLAIQDAATGRVVLRTDAAPSHDLFNGLTLAETDAGVSKGTDPNDPLMVVYGADLEVQEQAVGHLRLGYSTQALQEALAASLREAQAKSSTSARNQLLFAGIILLVGIMLGVIQAVRMTRQLQVLTVQAGNIASGDFDQRVSVSSRDEIGHLANSFNVMAESLGGLMHQMAGKASLERELEIARDIQRLMSPKPDLVHVGNYSLAGRCDMAEQCGGDWWTYRHLADGRVLIVVGDVTGHGTPAAMIAATARGAVEALKIVDPASLSPTMVLEAMDNAIRDVGESNLLMTAFSVLLDPRSRTIQFANAGHCFPYVSNREADGSLGELGVLALRGNPLGNARRCFNTWKREFTPGSVLVMATDGLADRVNKRGRRFGEKRLRRVLRESTVNNELNAAMDLRDHIVHNVDAFGGTAPADDDQTLVVCYFRDKGTLSLAHAS